MTERVRTLQPGSTRISTGMQLFRGATGAVAAGNRRERNYKAHMYPPDVNGRRHTRAFRSCYIRDTDALWYQRMWRNRAPITPTAEFTSCHRLQPGRLHPYSVWVKMTAHKQICSKASHQALIIYSRAEITLVWKWKNFTLWTEQKQFGLSRYTF